MYFNKFIIKITKESKKIFQILILIIITKKMLIIIWKFIKKDSKIYLPKVLIIRIQIKKLIMLQIKLLTIINHIVNYNINISNNNKIILWKILKNLNKMTNISKKIYFYHNKEI
jgi:hypothetical protein